MAGEGASETTPLAPADVEGRRRLERDLSAVHIVRLLASLHIFLEHLEHTVAYGNLREVGISGAGGVGERAGVMERECG